jgi:hypothetical protein
VRKRFLIAIVIVALTTLTGTAAAVVSGSAKNAQSRGVVLYVGDSNVTISTMEILGRMTGWDHFDNAYMPILAPRPGATIRTRDCDQGTSCETYNYWQIKLRAAWSQIQPDAVVNDLGINDTVEPGTETTPGYAYYGRKIDWFMRSIPKETPVLWTNLPCKIEPSARLEGCAVVNKALAAAGERWPNLVMLDWAKRANSHPEYLRDGDIHLSPAGSQAWTALVTAALDLRVPQPG